MEEKGREEVQGRREKGNGKGGKKENEKGGKGKGGEGKVFASVKIKSWVRP